MATFARTEKIKAVLRFAFVLARFRARCRVFGLIYGPRLGWDEMREDGKEAFHACLCTSRRGEGKGVCCKAGRVTALMMHGFDTRTLMIAFCLLMAQAWYCTG